MENFEVRKCESKELAIVESAKFLSFELDKFKTSGTPILFLLSGGSALEIIDRIDFSVLGSHITIAPLDERYDKDEDVNNFSQIIDTEFTIAARKEGVDFIDTRVFENDTHEYHAMRFASLLKKWRDSNPDGIILITQGIGPDGHTSGVMPFPENEEFFDREFDTKDKDVAYYDAKDKNKYRLRTTTTLSFLRDKVDLSIVFACGEDKLSALKKVSDEEGSLFETPARVVKEMKRVVIFTDQNI